MEIEQILNSLIEEQISHKQSNDNGQYFSNLAELNNLTIFPHKNFYKATWVSNNDQNTEPNRPHSRKRDIQNISFRMSTSQYG